MKKNGSNFEYQYSIADHEGNTRILFTSASPTAQSVTATFESAAQATESTQFNNYPSSSGIDPVASNNHTVGGTNSQHLHGGLNGQVGVSKSYAVLPGDHVQIEAYARYTAASGSSNLANFAAALLSAFQLSVPGVGETGTAPSAINNWGAIAAGGYGDGSTDSSNPKAFVNILIFDKNYNLLDLAYSQVTSSGSPGYLSASYTIKEPGYAYVYISNENPTLVDVYFDDVKMTYTPGNVIQSNEYYPFGLLTGNSWTRDSNKNNFLYNEGSELNTTSGLYDLPYRNYDAALGRFFQVDPMASRDHTLSPFVYGGDNPVNLNDPSGLMVDYMTSTGNPDYLAQLQWQAMEAQNNALAMSMWANSMGGGGGGGAISSSLAADARAVKEARMPFDEYVKKWGGKTITDPRAMAEVINYYAGSGQKSESSVNKAQSSQRGEGVGQQVGAQGSQGWKPLSKAGLAAYAKSTGYCTKCTSNQLGTLFEKIFETSAGYNSELVSANFKKNRSKFSSSSRPTVPDFIAESTPTERGRRVGSLPGAVWFEAKAWEGDLYASSSTGQLRGHIDNLYNLTLPYKDWVPNFIPTLYIVTTSDVTVSPTIYSYAAGRVEVTQVIAEYQIIHAVYIFNFPFPR